MCWVMIASAQKLFHLLAWFTGFNFFCTYKDNDDGEVTMDSTVDNTYQGTYIAEIYSNLIVHGLLLFLFRFKRGYLRV